MHGVTSESCHMASGGDNPGGTMAPDGQDDRRLREVLERVVRAEGRMKAAEALGVGYRTLVRAQESGVLTRRMRAALERLLFEGNEAAVTQVQEQVRALAQRVEEVVEESRDAREAAQSAAGELAALREEHAGTVLGLQRRLARLESRERGRGGKDPGAGKTGDPEAQPPEPMFPRLHPELVTLEPAPDDEEVYGAAWPLVDEWRGLRPNHRAGGKGLAWLIVEERVLELEVALIVGHGLTLPPDKEPVRGIWRESRLNWRKRALGDARRERAKAERRRHLRRVLTLGLWWE